MSRIAPVVPTVAVLCAAPRGTAVAAAIALALARACGRPFALAAAVGARPAASGALVPSSARAAARLRRDGLPARAGGRLVRLADRRAAEPGEDAAGAHGAGVGPQSDPAGAAAALSFEVGRAAAAVEAPAALAIPFARSPALDRVLGWHDAVVVVRAPDATAALLQLVLASIAALDRPVVAVPPPGRLAAAAATAGLHVPTFATAAVAQLGIGTAPR